MGRQSSRIYFNGADHKEMVTWDGTKYVYHDKAYIWTPQGFELVWEKLYGLKLLYESLFPLQPVSSENNKYLYFVENNDASIIYRLKINDKEPEPEEQYTSDKYNLFSAPVSSRGFGIYAEQRQYGYTYDYSILNLEDGTVSEVDTFDASEYLLSPAAMPPPTYVNQEVSPAELGNHNYASIFGSYLGYGQNWNFLYLIAPTGISAMMLDNREGTSTWISPSYKYDLGRMNTPSARGLLPRFLSINYINSVDNISVIEYGMGVEYGYYSTIFDETLPFMLRRYAGGGLAQGGIKTVRDDKLPVLSMDNHIWFIQVNDNSFTYTDTKIESPSQYTIFDVSPDYKYAMVFEDLSRSLGTKTVKIMDIAKEELVVDLSDEIDDLKIINAYFVGHKCIFVSGYYMDTLTTKYRLYKWR